MDLTSIRRFGRATLRSLSGAPTTLDRLSSGTMRDLRRLAIFSLVFCITGWSRADSDVDRGANQTKPRPVNFARDVRPILSDHCFACHGPDDQKRKAGLRLDTREGAFGKPKNGEPVIVPGKPDDSELVFRIESDDAELRMPPKKSGKPLSPDQVAVLRRWILEGAPWSTHWAFEPPKRPALPAVKRAGWAVTPIDRFILAKLESDGLEPAPQADKPALIRRVTLDLTGLPPTPSDVDAFMADSSPQAYERLVDRLLDSSRYGEHMARFWLDAARYGDTHGLHLDNYREAWPYRDWVIRAFGGNKPFDRFIVEQLAGDLLPNATLDQVIATGFNRCHVSTNEGGSIEEEVYVRNIVDQVDTNGTVFLGLTTGCARCHDHKYDPIRTKDYYQLFAFFNNIDGPPMDGNEAKWAPVAKVPTPAQALALKAAAEPIDRLREAIAKTAAPAVASYDLKADSGRPETPRAIEFVWVDDALPAGATPRGDGPWDFVGSSDHPVQSGSKALRNQAQGRNQRFFDDAPPKTQDRRSRHIIWLCLYRCTEPAQGIDVPVAHAGRLDASRILGANLIDWGTDGTPERLRMGDLPAAGRWTRLEVPVAKLKLPRGELLDGWAFTQFDGTVYWDRAGLVTDIPQDGQLFDSFADWVGSFRAGGPPRCLRTSRKSCSSTDRNAATRRSRNCSRTSSSMRIPGRGVLSSRCVPSSTKPSGSAGRSTTRS